MTNPLWRDPNYGILYSLPKSLLYFNTFYRLHFYSFHNLLFILIMPLLPLESAIELKESCHAIFTSDVFHESSSPKPLKITLRSFRIFWKFASQGAPLVSTIPGGKFANGVNDTSDKIAAGSKGTVSRDFYVRCFSQIIFPQAPENNTTVISNILKICKSRCTTGINNTRGQIRQRCQQHQRQNCCW